MKKYQILGFLLLIASIGIFQSSAFGVEDNDNDGVPNNLDLCPNLKEDYTGTIDGCPSTFVPWYDVDFDGIPDHIDTCPTVRETYNKFQDEDGCPDITPEQSRYKHDDDLDGIVNSYDLCPTIPEDYKGKIDGCPEQ